MTNRKSLARKRILDVLADGEWRTAAEIGAAANLAQSTVSSNLAGLTMVRRMVPALVEARRVVNPQLAEGGHGSHRQIVRYRLYPNEGSES